MSPRLRPLLFLVGILLAVPVLPARSMTDEEIIRANGGMIRDDPEILKASERAAEELKKNQAAELTLKDKQEEKKKAAEEKKMLGEKEKAELEKSGMDSDMIASSTMSAALLAAAKNNVGMDTTGIPGTDGGNLACAAAVNAIAEKSLGYPIGGGASTAAMQTSLQNLVSSGAAIETSSPVPGAIIISATQGSNIGHVGIVGEGGAVYSNSSSAGEFKQNYSVSSWQNYYGDKKGLDVKYYVLVGPVNGQTNLSAAGLAASEAITSQQLAVVEDWGAGIATRQQKIADSMKGKQLTMAELKALGNEQKELESETRIQREYVNALRANLARIDDIREMQRQKAIAARAAADSANGLLDVSPAKENAGVLGNFGVGVDSVGK